MKIHPVTHNEELVEGQIRQRFCGPAAISAITGRSAECASVWINHARSRPAHHNVGGAYTSHVLEVLSRLGYRWTSQWVTQVEARRIGRTNSTRPTFAQWLRSADRDRSKLYLVVAGNHFMVVKGTKVVCTHQPQGNPTTKAKNRRYLVRAVYEIRKASSPISERIRRMRLDPLPRWDKHAEERRMARHSDSYGAVPKRRWPKKHEVTTW